MPLASSGCTGTAMKEASHNANNLVTGRAQCKSANISERFPHKIIALHQSAEPRLTPNSSAKTGKTSADNRTQNPT
jgi:hypothetical protein